MGFAKNSRCNATIATFLCDLFGLTTCEAQYTGVFPDTLPDWFHAECTAATACITARGLALLNESGLAIDCSITSLNAPSGGGGGGKCEECAIHQCSANISITANDSCSSINTGVTKYVNYGNSTKCKKTISDFFCGLASGLQDCNAQTATFSVSKCHAAVACMTEEGQALAYDVGLCDTTSKQNVTCDTCDISLCPDSLSYDPSSASCSDLQNGFDTINSWAKSTTTCKNKVKGFLCDLVSWSQDCNDQSTNLNFDSDCQSAYECMTLDGQAQAEQVELCGTGHDYSGATSTAASTGGHATSANATSHNASTGGHLNGLLAGNGGNAGSLVGRIAAGGH